MKKVIGDEAWRETLKDATFLSGGIEYTFDEWLDRETKEVICIDCGRKFKALVPKKCPAELWREECAKCQNMGRS